MLLSVKGVTKRFGSATALEGFDLDVSEGEFVSLLGPSGCGKTTLLRIVGGFERPTAGGIELGGRDVTRLAPNRRPVNYVFQRYLLLPHLSVFENVAFGLRVSGCPRREIAPRVKEALALVQLEGFEDRRPDQLSGGQSQRISLARALVNRPSLLLLDEPLSALDQRVRLEMQAELRRIQRETGTTFLYVTHDQQEAMALSDRIVVMDAGKIEQTASPAEIYHQPATRFVARFVGDANVLAVERSTDAPDGPVVRVHGTDQEMRISESLPEPSAWLVLRPEALRLEGAGYEGLTGRVSDVAFLGADVAYRVDVEGVDIRVREAGRHPTPTHAVGDLVAVVHDPDRCSILAGSGSNAATRPPRSTNSDLKENRMDEQGRVLDEKAKS